MIGIVFLILLILYLLTLRSIDRREISYTCLFLYTFFFIVAISMAKDQFMAKARYETSYGTQPEFMSVLKFGVKQARI